MKPNIGQGDKGYTGCLKGTKVSKSSKLVKFIGELDELNSFIGLARSFVKSKDVDRTLEKIQEKIFTVGSIIAGAKLDFGEKDVKFVEEEIQKYEKELKPLKHFIFPTGTKSSSLLQVARAVCRRVERSCVEAKQKDFIPFFNRLSDLLFVLARIENKRSKVKEKEWIAKK